MSAINLDQLKQRVAEARKQSQESYLSLKLDINAHDGQAVVMRWSCYTPNSNHTRAHATPEAALQDTLLACSDPGKLLQQAEAFEAEARKLRQRISA